MYNGKPTIFLMVNRVFSQRFLLRTDILRTLREAPVNVVILATNTDDPYFRAEFEAPTVIVEQYREEEAAAYFKKWLIQGLLRIIRSIVMSDKGDLTTARQLERVHLETLRRPGGFRHRAAALVVEVVVPLLRRSRWLRRSLVWVETNCFCPSIHADLFIKYQPELVVTTSLGYPMSGWDAYIMREARQHGAKVAAVVLSWDNPSSKGLKGGYADYVIAWTEVMKQELVTYHDLDPDAIWVCGPPHWDMYYHTPQLSRDALFRMFRLDPSRKLLFFGTKAPAAFAWNGDIAEILVRAIKDGRLYEPCQLLVRVHPLHFRSRGNPGGAKAVEDTLAHYRQLEERFEHVRFDYPQIISQTLDMPESEMHKVAAILSYSAVTINIYSTLNIEAAIFDCPIVNVSFNGDRKIPPDSRKDVALDEAQPHNQRIVRSGGITQPRSEDELIAAINAYLRDPSLHAEGRHGIRLNETGMCQGHAGRAIAEHLLQFAAGRVPPRATPVVRDTMSAHVDMTSGERV